MISLFVAELFYIVSLLEMQKHILFLKSQLVLLSKILIIIIITEKSKIFCIYLGQTIS